MLRKNLVSQLGVICGAGSKLRFKHQPVPGLKPRMLVGIANTRSLERSGIDPGAAGNLAGILAV
jgi:hypothetical protein